MLLIATDYYSTYVSPRAYMPLVLGYFGTAGDAMFHNSGLKFTKKDLRPI